MFMPTGVTDRDHSTRKNKLVTFLLILVAYADKWRQFDFWTVLFESLHHQIFSRFSHSRMFLYRLVQIFKRFECGFWVVTIVKKLTHLGWQIRMDIPTVEGMERRRVGGRLYSRLLRGQLSQCSRNSLEPLKATWHSTDSPGCCEKSGRMSLGRLLVADSLRSVPLDRNHVLLQLCSLILYQCQNQESLNRDSCRA